MPALEQKVIDDLTERLGKFLSREEGNSAPAFLDAGGSAAIFRVDTKRGARAFKAYCPDLFTGPRGNAERRRLDVQRRLVGHQCESLVQTFSVEEMEGTAFIEMEFVPWPKLSSVLTDVPDLAIPSLFAQLVNAVRFLDDSKIVHRDIKPENIHISQDFANLKLLDLGVARELDLADENEAAVTDHGNLRPFLATAQYSSPEYLFRLDEPSMKLWKGLNFYQLGAVLHDLVMKEPLFHHEMGFGNRWLVARAVLTKTPSFADGIPKRLANLKALAARCLAKDIDARLQCVGWEDFILEGAKDPLTALRARLAKGVNVGLRLREAAASRLEFDRSEFVRRFSELVRAELLPACGTSLPVVLKPSAPGEQPLTQVTLTIDKQLVVACEVQFVWQEHLYERTANILLNARILCNGFEELPAKATSKLVAVVEINGNESESAFGVAGLIAQVANSAMDMVEGTEDSNTLHGVDLQDDDLHGEHK